MSKTTAPLLSFDARGQLGETLVYSSWKGRPYARRYVIPANPRTEAQTATRTTFAGLNNLWRYMPAAAQAAWNLYGDNSRFTARNGWLKFNVSPLRSASDLSGILLSPAAGGGLALTGLAAAADAGGTTVTADEPTLPAGWTLDAVHAIAVRNDDPHTIETAEVHSGTSTEAPFDVSITGLTTGTEYVVGAWPEFTKADGSKAYGASVQALVTPV